MWRIDGKQMMEMCRIVRNCRQQHTTGNKQRNTQTNTHRVWPSADLRSLIFDRTSLCPQPSQAAHHSQACTLVTTGNNAVSGQVLHNKRPDSTLKGPRIQLLSFNEIRQTGSKVFVVKKLKTNLFNRAELNWLHVIWAIPFTLWILFLLSYCICILYKNSFGNSFVWQDRKCLL